uniref:Uncharacterized protein n=2 Tax=Ciona intestinalis TaxID=7719 RepID=H2XKP4_CIOIN
MDLDWPGCKNDLAKDIHDTLKARENFMLRLTGS